MHTLKTEHRKRASVNEPNIITNLVVIDPGCDSISITTLNVIGLNILIITLNMISLNIPMKRQQLSEWIKKKIRLRLVKSKEIENI